MSFDGQDHPNNTLSGETDDATNADVLESAAGAARAPITPEPDEASKPPAKKPSVRP